MIHFILSFSAVFLSVKLVGIEYAGWGALLIFTLILALMNATVKPVVKFITWPINFLTLGIFHLVLNVLLLMIISSLTPNFTLVSFWQAAVFAVVLSVTEWILYKFDI